MSAIVPAGMPRKKSGAIRSASDDADHERVVGEVEYEPADYDLLAHEVRWRRRRTRTSARASRGYAKRARNGACSSEMSTGLAMVARARLGVCTVALLCTQTG